MTANAKSRRLNLVIEVEQVMTKQSKSGLEPRYFTQNDLAVYFSVSPNTISRWRVLEHDPLPGVTMPGMKQPRFDIIEVQAWIDRRTAC